MEELHFLESQKAWFRYGYQGPWTTVYDVIDLIHRTEPLFGPTNIRNIINLTVALGSVLVALLSFFGGLRLVNFFWVFAGLMAAAGLFFGLRAYFYVQKDYTQQ